MGPHPGTQDLLDILTSVQLVWRSGRRGSLPAGWLVHSRVTAFFHFVRLEEGGFSWWFEDHRRRSLEKGEALLAPPRREHGLHTPDGARIVWADFRLPVHGGLEATSFLLFPERLTAAQAEPIAQAALALSAGSAEVSPGTWYRRQAALVAAVLDLTRWRPDVEARLPALQRVQPLLALVRRNLAERWDRSSLCRAAGLAPTRLTAVFRKAAGTTPAKSVMNLRLERAAELLLSSSASLNDVAAQVGLCDGFHLSKRFRRYAGVSPAEYRRRFRGWWR